MRRRHVLALPLVAAVAPAVAEAAVPRAQEVRSLIALEPGDWGPWYPLPDVEALPPVDAKWHKAIGEIRYQLEHNPGCLAATLPDTIEVSLLDATSERHWLDGESVPGAAEFVAGPLPVTREAAFDETLWGLPVCIANKRIRDFLAYVNASEAKKYGMNGCGSSLLDQDRWMWDKLQDGVWFIEIKVVLS